MRPDDIDTTPTSEPDISSLPEEYKAPDPPKEESSKPAETSNPPKEESSKPAETSNPPLESVNEEAPVASGVDEEEVQSGTVDPNLLDQFY